MGNRKIMLAVDLQKDFIDGSLAVKDAYKVIPVINEEKKKFDLVYFTLDWHPSNHCSFKEQGGLWPAHCVHHTAGASLPDEVLNGLEESRIRFKLKGCDSSKEEYGALAGTDAKDYFENGDEVVICGIASEYCVLETLKNITKLASSIDLKIKVFLKGTARFASYDTLQAYMSENGIEEYKS